MSKDDPIKLEHLTELRSAVNQLRQHAGLPDYNFTVDPNPQRGVTAVRADHVRQLRVALEEARLRLNLSTSVYEHPTLTNYVSLIYAKDFQELRDQVGARGVATRPARTSGGWWRTSSARRAWWWTRRGAWLA